MRQSKSHYKRLNMRKLQLNRQTAAVQQYQHQHEMC